MAMARELSTAGTAYTLDSAVGSLIDEIKNALFVFKDETGNGNYFGVSDFISGDHRNHVRLANPDVELGDAFVGRNDADGDVETDAAISAVGTTTELLEKQEMTVTLVAGERRNTGVSSTKNDVSDSPDGYITRLDKFGNIQQVPVNFSEVSVEEEPNPLADFMSTDILAKPFNFVSGNVSKSRFNPFRKKSGLLNVLARQATKNRIVNKNGMLNTVGSADGKKHKFFKDIFISLIDLNWGWIFLLFAAGFFLSWLGFAVVWYLTFLAHGDLDPVNQVPFGSRI